MTGKTALEYLPARIWLMKTEPDVFSFSDLIKKPFQQEVWDGVRNYQARNFMRDHMQVGHTVLFYHSNADPSGIVGLCEVIKSAVPDVSALQIGSPYYDAKVTAENNPWVAVTVGNPVWLKNFVSLQKLRTEKILTDMLLLRRGQRLSVLPVSELEFNFIMDHGSGKV